MKILKKVLLVILITQVSVLTNAQDFITNPDSILYLPGISEPDSSWNDIGFDDSAWKLGTGIIGFGDVVNTEISPVQTFYTRSYFNIDSKENFEEMIMYCDFDDGFVAYINGVEFARVNLGEFVSKTTYNQLTDRSHDGGSIHESENPVLGYYIDKAFIDSVFIEGQNVLSIEVHNDSVNGSDLSFKGNLVDRTGVVHYIFDRFARYKKCVELDSTKLPIIVIESNEYGIPHKRIEVPGTIGIIDNGVGNYNKPGEPFNGHSGPIQIEVRGESSAIFPKRSYDFELRDEQDKDTSISLLGMPRGSDWILQGPFADKSQIRNAMIYELGRRTGHWTPRVKFCEVIINGEYVGLYNLMEKIKRDSNRINIAKLRETEIEGSDLTGGYILKYDKPGGLFIVYPKESNLQPEQENYILNLFYEYDTVLNSDIGLDSEIGYKKYIDENSLIDYIIIAEFAKNCDSYLFSSYLYKDKIDRDERIKFGPLWDFDLCFGNSIWQDGHQTYNWQFDFPLNNKFNIQRLFEDPNLVDQFEDRWFELRDGMLHIDSLFSMIDSLTSYLAEPLRRNYEVWPLESKGIFYPAYIAPNYSAEIDSVKTWISERVAWMDNNISDIYYPVTDYTSSYQEYLTENNSFEADVYPNPFTKEFYINLNIPKSGNLLVELINIQGKVTNIIDDVYVEQGSYKVYWTKGAENLTPGMYLISIKIDGMLYGHLQVLNME